METRPKDDPDTKKADGVPLATAPCSAGPANGMGMMAWLATEGGRKCPQCGKYAKPEHLGWNGLRAGSVIADRWGHLPGFGCNKLSPAQLYNEEG